jgi:hypothetical protein
MASCQTICAKRPPRSSYTQCQSKTRPGGVSRLIFADCALRFTDLENPSEWCKYVMGGRIGVSNPVTGDVPKPSFQKRRISSCGAETVTGVERTLNFKDLLADEINFSDYDFWNTIQSNISAYQFGYLTCDGKFYGFIDNVSIEVGNVHEETDTGVTMWDGSIMWTKFEEIKPIKIDNLLSILLGQCTDVVNYTSCETPSVTSPNGLNICVPGSTYLEATYFVDATYQWNIGGTPIPGETQNIFYPDGVGSYTVTINRPGCATFTSPSSSVTSSQPDITSVTPSGPAPADVTITPVGASTDFVYSLILSNGVQVPFSPSNVFTNVPAGIHTAVVKEILTGCIKTQLFTVLAS